MTADNKPVNLDFDLPAQPRSLIELAALLRSRAGLSLTENRPDA